MSGGVLDVLLCGLLLLLSGWVLAAPRSFHAVVAFFAFGMMMALAWVRLGAVDIALTEAAIGAGLTGAFLLAACSRLADRRPAAAAPGRPPGRTGPRRLKGAATGTARLALSAAAVALAVGWAVLELPAPSGELPQRVRAALAESGVANPVTAVLLNFRGYDTLLEIAVLLLAAVGAQAAGGAPPRPPLPHAAPLLTAYLRAAAPLMLLFAGFILWAGGAAAGGAFQAGAVAAAAGILAALAPPFERRFPPSRLAAAMALGLLVFGAVGLAAMAGGWGFLEYPPGWAGALILAIEAAAAVSIAAVMVSLFNGLLGTGGEGPRAMPAGRAGKRGGGSWMPRGSTD